MGVGESTSVVLGLDFLISVVTGNCTSQTNYFTSGMREELELETHVPHLQFSDRHCEVSSLTGTEDWRSLLYAQSKVEASEKNVTCDHPAF